ncbi:alpha/beta hydrolase [Staphylococcus simiae]|uniref:Lysophospholipase n=1 Tax=Staphylococcus simiae CCM 7213 = CCUG 51256 TaxID=911238 RepID=G5JIM7_9STAP|nr:alpha/beta hydrolase [Staphylococcus simiae]EHJ07933.1 lysophospholipase [Staphylococcus simiae CCM 7213 = CCUG 51256]PNZ12684.1 alpha/beta hydrolase [Staphylococcus simiae]SNV69981.1 hydrolase [Staphylococcus simiae]
MTTKSFKLTVIDDTNIEVKVDYTDIPSRGFIHIFHGMAEHMERYDKLTQALNQQGFDVIRHNHRGHGKDIDETTRGHYDDMRQVVSDAFEIAQTIRSNHDKPYFVLGHSMGSIIARLFVETYPHYCKGLILSGTAMYPSWKSLPAIFTLTVMARSFGQQSRLSWLNHILTKSFNKNISPLRTTSDWLSSDSNEVDKYIRDPYCGFEVSTQLLHQTLFYMHHTTQFKHLMLLNQDMPILLIAGYEDPFGDYGQGVLKLAKRYRKAGIKDVKVKLYHDKRHEILFEHGYREVWKELFLWLNKNI